MVFPRYLTTSLLLTVLMASGLLAVEPKFDSLFWPCFRGEDRTGVSPDEGLLQEWPESGPNLVWQSEGMGRGYSSVTIANGRLYSMGDNTAFADDEDEYLLCLNVADGKLIWKTRLGPAWNQGSSTWQSSRSTPTIHDKFVYALTAHGELVCVDATQGIEKWRKHLKDDLGGKKGDGWGYSESVLIDGDRLICTPGGEAATMVALDKLTGETVWTCSRKGDRGAGHASVVISQVGGVKVYVQTTASGAMGVRAEDGELQWTYDIDPTTSVIPTPIIRDDLVFFTAGYGRGGALLKQAHSANDSIEMSEVYPLNKELANKHGGVILVGDYLYGDADGRGIIWCAELMTGKVLWKKRGTGRGSSSVTAADGHVYVHASNGVVSLVKADPEKFTEVSAFEVPGAGERPSWAHPVIVGKLLFLRENNRVLCYNLDSAG